MPTVLQLRSIRIVIYPNDHRPAHVHAIGKSKEAVYLLQCLEGSIELRENYGFARHELSSLRRDLVKNQQLLCDAWEKVHGDV